MFQGRLGPIETRESTWQLIRGLGVDGRLFYGYTTEESYDCDFMRKVCALPCSISAANNESPFVEWEGGGD
jgi:hypothetical protein